MFSVRVVMVMRWFNGRKRRRDGPKKIALAEDIGNDEKRTTRYVVCK
jgi:hypothetical protein